MPTGKTALRVGGALLCTLMGLHSQALAQPATQPAAAATTRPVTQPAIFTVRKASLAPEIQAEGTLQWADAFELKLRLKAYQGPLTIISAAAPGAAVRKGDSLLELETKHFQWAMEGAENELATARASLQKAQADAEIAAKSEALALRIQEDAVKNAEAAVKWWETMDGPQMLLSADLGVKQVKDSLDDQEDELAQLRKMYKSEELTNATADIVIRRALRRAEMTRISLKMQEERRDKLKAQDYPNSRQRVLDAAEQARLALASLKLTQAQAGVARKAALSAARIAAEQAEQKVADLKHDSQFFAVKAPFDGVVMYGQFADGAWASGDPKLLRAGEKLTAGSVVLKLGTPGRLNVEVSIPENRIAWLAAGSKARVTPAGFQQLACEGTCSAPVIAPKGNPASLGYQVSIALANPSPQLLPGTKVSTRVESQRLDDVLLVPATSIFNGKVCLRGPDGKLEKRAVMMGRSDGQMVEIRSGLSAGDEILTVAEQ